VKYAHAFHAGNFADVHKHVTLVALLQALEHKDKGFLYLETHAGRGAYELDSSAEGRASAPAIARLIAQGSAHPELVAYAGVIEAWRARNDAAQAYPGSPLIAALLLRPQDRAVLIEIQAEEAAALERVLPRAARAHVMQGDGFQALRAHLPPRERRGLTLIDPPYEAAGDFARAATAVTEALRRFATGIVALWYPIKDSRDTAAWLDALRPHIEREALLAELWVHPCDSRVALNGSGVLIVNPPFRLRERMRSWLADLHRLLDPQLGGGTRVRLL